MTPDAAADDGLRLFVTGARGRMGRTVIERARERPDVALVGGASRDVEEAIEVDGVRIDPADDLGGAIDTFAPDALVDFSGAFSSVRYVEVAAERAVPCVVGTTGFTDEQLERLRAAAEVIPVLKAANFALGVQVLYEITERLARLLAGYDVEITETYHNQKPEAPSGTVKAIISTIDPEGRRTPVYGREGEGTRDPTEIGVHVRRAGAITGETEVMFAANHEVVSVTHRAEDRAVFASGSLEAAAWLAGCEPGWYGFGDVLADRA